MVDRWKSKKTGDAKLASAMFLGLPSARLACRSFRIGLWHACGRWIPLRRPPTLRLAIVAVIANLTGPGPRQAFCSDTIPSRYQGSPRPRGGGAFQASRLSSHYSWQLFLSYLHVHAAVAARLSQIMLHHLPFSGLKPLPKS